MDAMVRAPAALGDVGFIISSSSARRLDLGAACGLIAGQNRAPTSLARAPAVQLPIDVPDLAPVVFLVALLAQELANALLRRVTFRRPHVRRHRVHDAVRENG
jgi:hypothetical protein